ncbi:Scr1 family TA system antitoxin-like transcriptional regulator [Streptomyces sp. NPDC046859]|uniref:Scr1 family TA system antitoxin-like transcriptional regulator n=1 Tax=Streptomyces sp. NPDC046859 TaxID=3155734 RepID=UPI0033CE40E0
MLFGETAPRSLTCPPAVLAAQLDRLAGLVALDTVALGVIPFTASPKIPPAGGFWVHDERLVIVENRHAELWTPTPSPCNCAPGACCGSPQCTAPVPSGSSVTCAGP